MRLGRYKHQIEIDFFNVWYVNMSFKIRAWTQTVYRSRGGASCRIRRKPLSTAGRSEIPHGATSQINMVLNAKEPYGAKIK